MGRREENDPKQATAPRECGQWRGTSELRVGVRGLPAALAAYLNQIPSLTPGYSMSHGGRHLSIPSCTIDLRISECHSHLAPFLRAIPPDPAEIE